MKKVHVYNNTHWDYEWYFTANESVIQLIYHMDEVISALESGELNYYLLDGQVSIVEEYLKFVPQNRERIKKLIEEKKLFIGPWYTQTDELIISGESIARNLFYGINSAKRLGGYMNVGYLPDSFGQSKDMPKIFNGFGIKDFIFWRGLSSSLCPDREFIWKSEDGSEVLTYNIKNGYYYGGNLIYNDDVKQVEETFLNGVTKENILLSVGGDQRYVDFNLKERIEYYNSKSENNLEYVESNCEKFFEELRKEEDFKEVSGEFLAPSNSKIHRSIYSSRYDHKYLNDKIERKLIYHLEPLMVMGQKLGLDLKNDMLETIWKKLLLNHAHDSACGCNTDKTNSLILSRLTEADQLSYSACDYIVRKICESMEDKQENDIYIFNTLPYRRENPIKLEISTKSKDFIIENIDGKELTYQVLSQERVYSGSIKRTPEEHNPELYYYITKIFVDYPMKPFSIEKIRVVEKAKEKQESSKKEYIEDSFFKIYFENGKLNLLNKSNSEVLEEFIYFEESGDDGDTYDYSPPQIDNRMITNISDSDIEIIDGELVKILKIKGGILSSESLEKRERNLFEKEIAYELELSLDNSGNIKTHLVIDNNVKDHRVRAIIKSGIKTTHSTADTPFGVIKRENNPINLKDWKELKWKEEPTPIYPFINFISLKNSDNSMSIFAKGIKEYEVIEDDKVALTLFRGVGFLGKPDLIRRPGVASGQEFKYIETPDSQLLKKMTFKFAIRFDKKYNGNKIREEYQKYSISTLNYQIQEINRFTTTLKYFVMHPLKEKLTTFTQLINLSESKLALSSIVPIDKESYLLRLVNLGSAISEDKIEINFGVKAERVNMLNEKIDETKNIENGILKLENIRCGEIINLKIYI